MGWIYLLLAGACEILYAAAMPKTNGFTQLWPSLFCATFIAGSMQPVWNGQEFEPRLMLPLSLSYDHRVINGADAARFSHALTEILADIRRVLL